MRKNRVGIILISLIFVCAFFVLPGKKQVQASGTVLYSGECGANASWTLDDEGVLRISGTGPMYDYDWNYGSEPPWYSLKVDPSDEYSPRVAQKLVKSIVIEEGITTVGKNAFRQCEKAESIVIPSTVTEIKYGGFWQCFQFKTVTIPGNVKKLGEHAFANCYSITSLTIEEGVEEIGDDAFDSCSRIPEFNLPSTITTIGESAFSWCTSLKEIVIPDGVTSISAYMFYNVDSLEKVVLPSSITELGEKAFANTGISSIVIPDGVTVIPDQCFDGCYKLTSITLPSGLKKIESRAFNACSQLPSIDLPDSLETMESGVFASCTSLKEVEFPAKITSIPDTTFEYSGIESVKSKGTLTSIGYHAFYDCDIMTSFAIPEGVTTIGEEAFYSCNHLTSVTFPSSVTEINYSTFAYCTWLSDIFCYADPDALTWYGYGGYDLGYAVRGGTLCHVPQSKVDEYKTSLSNVTRVTVVGDLIDLDLGEHLAGYSLSLAGDIGVNFYMFLDNSVATSNTAKMVFTVSSLDGSDVRTKEIPVKSASTTTLGGRTCYIFTCHVNAKEMTSRITAQIVDGESSGKEYDYSVGEYAKYILDHGKRYEDESGVVQFLLKYGAAAQLYFNYNTSLLADEYLPESDRWMTVENSYYLRQYEYTGATKIGDDVQFYKANLSLESVITMNLQFKGVPENAVFKLGDTVLPTKKSGDITTVSIKNIAAHAVDDFYEVSLYVGDTCLGSVTYSPLNYCYNVLQRATTATRTYELKVLVSMLYYYNDYADYYYNNVLH